MNPYDHARSSARHYGGAGRIITPCMPGSTPPRPPIVISPTARSAITGKAWT